MNTLVVTIPGRAYQLAQEATLDAKASRAIDGAQVTRRGRGTQATLSMTPGEANALADYFWSLAGVVGDMTASERDGGNEHGPAQQAVLRIEAVLRESTKAKFRVNFCDPARPSKIIRAGSLREAQDRAAARWPMYQVAGVTKVRG